MDCALWLNRRKIYTAAEICENLDIASLRGYLLAGTLIPWLEEHEGKRFVKRLAALKHDDPGLNGKLAEIFGGASEAVPFKALDGGSGNIPESCFAAALSSYNVGSAGSYNYAALSSFGSFYGFLQAVTSGNVNSFEFTRLSGYNTSGGSFTYGWEWLWSYIQSLYGGSFVTASSGSFTGGWEWLWSYIQSLYGGSFVTASSGSFTGGWEWLWSYIQSLYGGSFVTASYGSFTGGWEWLWSYIQSLYGGSFVTASSGSFTGGWEWLWSYIQSLYGGSFMTASFGSFSYGWEWLWSYIQSLYGGSFMTASFGSFTGGWEWLAEFFKNYANFGSYRGLPGSFDPGSFNFNINTKFTPDNSDNFNNLPELRLDEYDLILLKTLIECPLDRFGYGIHNI